MQLSFSIRTAWLWKPWFVYKKRLTDQAKANGSTIWWFNWLCFSISYNRLL